MCRPWKRSGLSVVRAFSHHFFVPGTTISISPSLTIPGRARAASRRWVCRLWSQSMSRNWVFELEVRSTGPIPVQNQ
jgi:hypothetical protein